MQPFLALITPLTGDAHPEHPIVYPPPLDPNAPRPSHPIAKPGDPWWGQDLHPSHPIVIPPGSIDPGPPPVPTHPIYLPPGIWGPTDPRPTPPIYWPGFPGGGGGQPPGVPTHPIMLPGMPGWGDPHPEHPIYYPPAGSAPPPIAVVVPAPPSDPPEEVPAGLPPESTKVYLWYGPGTKATEVWVPPYGTTKPVK